MERIPTGYALGMTVVFRPTSPYGHCEEGHSPDVAIRIPLLALLSLFHVKQRKTPPQDGVFFHIPALLCAYPTKITIRVFPSASSCFSTVAAKPANFRVSTARLTEL